MGIFHRFFSPRLSVVWWCLCSLWLRLAVVVVQAHRKATRCAMGQSTHTATVDNTTGRECEEWEIFRLTNHDRAGGFLRCWFFAVDRATFIDQLTEDPSMSAPSAAVIYVQLFRHWRCFEASTIHLTMLCAVLSVFGIAFLLKCLSARRDATAAAAVARSIRSERRRKFR